MKNPTRTLDLIPKKWIDATIEAPRRADDICSDHDDDCYTPTNGQPHDALSCWMSAPECGICPLLQKGEKHAK